MTLLFLLTLLATAFSYPYPTYYQPYLLRTPRVMGQPGVPAGGMSATGMGAGGMGAGGMAGNPMMMFNMMMQNFFKLFFPQWQGNMGQLMMLDQQMDGDIAEASEKFMQGDVSEAMDKMMDSSDVMGLMAMGRGGGMPGTPGAGMGGAAMGGAGAGGFGSMPMSMKLASPRPRTYVQPVVYPNGAVQYFPVNPVNGRLRQMA